MKVRWVGEVCGCAVRVAGGHIVRVCCESAVGG